MAIRPWSMFRSDIKDQPGGITTGTGRVNWAPGKRMHLAQPVESSDLLSATDLVDASAQVPLAGM